MPVSFLQIEELTKSFGDRMLFDSITLGINEGDKIGLIARNGAGKSTLLSIIAGKEDADSGEVVARNGLRIGYLEQESHFDSGRSLLENVAEEVSTHNDEPREDIARRMLTQFGIQDCDRLPLTYSGGQLKRAALARTLLSEPDLLILDEPTNHLDIEIIEWLENYLTRKRVTLLMVTHDRYFLDNVCNRILELDRRTIYSYEGNYDYYLRRRAEREEALSAELARVKNLLRTELDWMRRQPQARGSKAKYRIDNFHDLQAKSRMGRTEKEVTLGVKSSYIGSKIFEAKNVSKAFGDNMIITDWSYTFARYEKVGIVGPNGVGKSTFIKMLLGELAPDSGSFDIGETVRWGYYSQEGISGFDEKKKVIDAVRDIAEVVRIDDKTTLSASQFLCQFLFTPETQQSYIYKLSGGERRRLYLATVLMRNPNFLILDEPTNDLDIMTLTILEDYLARFKGCVIVVSHDRFFLDRIADHLFVFRGNGVVKDFPGDYSTLRHCIREEERERKAAEATEKREEAEPKRPARGRKPGLTYKERREMEALEQKLDELNREKSGLEESLNAGTLSHEQLSAASARIGELIGLIDEAEFRLLELMEKDA